MRPPLLRISTDEIIIDSFAGGGGASTGIELALCRSPDIAINHDAEALALHTANHPTTRHYCESVWYVDPVEVTAGRRVGLTWFSPDCKRFSRAKGGKPVEKAIRGLAWVAVKWAKTVRPRVICIENVEEFADWGPLADDGRPCPMRKGHTFRRFVRQLSNCGYTVDWQEIRACDYGAPTIRKRLFLVARCDGQPIVWPEATHGRGLLPYRTAAECIDWSIPCPSIFERSRPLAENTLRRIARGVQRYVVEAGQPFIAPVTHAGDSRVHPIGEPLRTITSAQRGEFALVSPTLIEIGYGEAPGQAPRVPGLSKPLGTVVAGGGKHALVAAFLAKHYGGVVGSPLTDPMHTVTATDHNALVTSHLLKLRGTCKDGQPVTEPMPTICAGGTPVAEVRAFLLAYYGTEQAPQLRGPLPTVTTRDRFGLVTVHGIDYQIVDIGMRTLEPRELYRAQGFPDEYRIDIEHGGKRLSKAAQVRMCGNSVAPPAAAAIVTDSFTQKRFGRLVDDGSIPHDQDRWENQVAAPSLDAAALRLIAPGENVTRLTEPSYCGDRATRVFAHDRLGADSDGPSRHARSTDSAPLHGPLKNNVVSAIQRLHNPIHIDRDRTTDELISGSGGFAPANTNKRSRIVVPCSCDDEGRQGDLQGTTLRRIGVFLQSEPKLTVRIRAIERRSWDRVSGKIGL